MQLLETNLGRKFGNITPLTRIPGDSGKITTDSNNENFFLLKFDLSDCRAESGSLKPSLLVMSTCQEGDICGAGVEAQ